MIFDQEDYKAFDPEIWEAVAKEEERQQLSLIHISEPTRPY